MPLLDYLEAESAAVFSNSQEFAEPATYTPQGGSARSVTGIFDRVSELTDIGELLAADGVAASYNVHQPDFPEARLGDALSIRGHDYRVVGLEPDGTGRIVMVLGL